MYICIYTICVFVAVSTHIYHYSEYYRSNKKYSLNYSETCTIFTTQLNCTSAHVQTLKWVWLTFTGYI